MVGNRFLCKTDKYGITITAPVVVMLLLFISSCSGEKKEVVAVEFDPENTYTMRSTDVSSLISDSGITRYKIITKEWLNFGKAADPYSYFPEGIYLEKFDSLMNVEASVKADTAYQYEKKGLIKLAGNVDIQNSKGERFETSLLFWDQKEQKVYSDKYIRITQEDQIITGIGFESNQDMTKYKIFNSQGTFPVSETPADSTEAVSATSSVSNVAKTDSIKK